MKNILNLMIISFFLMSISCGQNSNTANSAIKSDVVVVNRIKEVAKNDGTKSYFGEVGLVRGAKTTEELNQMVENGQVTYLSENAIQESGITFGDSVEADGTSEQFGWAALGTAFLLGWATSPRYNYPSSVYYYGSPIYPTSYHSYSYQSSYYRTCYWY